MVCLPVTNGTERRIRLWQSDSVERIEVEEAARRPAPDDIDHRADAALLSNLAGETSGVVESVMPCAMEEESTVAANVSNCLKVKGLELSTNTSIS